MQIFISLNLFFCAIKNQFFQTLIHMLNSEFVIQLSDWTKFCDLLNQIYDVILKNLITDQEFFIKISFAVDDWSSSNKLSFLDMNCYYISENWKYWERLVEFELLFDSHDDQNLREIVKRIILKQNLKTHLLTIITDNADNNNTIWKKIANKLNWLHDMKWNKKWETIFCLAYVIQFVMKKLISALKIKVCNKLILISFNEDNVNMMKNVLIFKNIFCKTSFW